VYDTKYEIEKMPMKAASVIMMDGPNEKHIACFTQQEEKGQCPRRNSSLQNLHLHILNNIKMIPKLSIPSISHSSHIFTIFLVLMYFFWRIKGVFIQYT
jgi:hypothetical protein